MKLSVFHHAAGLDDAGKAANPGRGINAADFLIAPTWRVQSLLGSVQSPKWGRVFGTRHLAQL